MIGFSAIGSAFHAHLEAPEKAPVQAPLRCHKGAVMQRPSGRLSDGVKAPVKALQAAPLRHGSGVQFWRAFKRCLRRRAPLRRSSGTVQAPLQHHEGAVSGAVKGAAEGTIKCDAGASRVCAVQESLVRG